MMRAKLKVLSVEQFEHCDNLKLQAVCRADGYSEDGRDENNTFATFTPTANLEMTVTNPDLIGKIRPGKTFLVDFTEVDEQINRGVDDRESGGS